MTFRSVFVTRAPTRAGSRSIVGVNSPAPLPERAARPPNANWASPLAFRGGDIFKAEAIKVLGTPGVVESRQGSAYLRGSQSRAERFACIVLAKRKSGFILDLVGIPAALSGWRPGRPPNDAPIDEVADI